MFIKYHFKLDFEVKDWKLNLFRYIFATDAFEGNSFTEVWSFWNEIFMSIPKKRQSHKINIKKYQTFTDRRVSNSSVIFSLPHLKLTGCPRPWPALPLDWQVQSPPPTHGRWCEWRPSNPHRRRWAAGKTYQHHPQHGDGMQPFGFPVKVDEFHPPQRL